MKGRRDDGGQCTYTSASPVIYTLKTRYHLRTGIKNGRTFQEQRHKASRQQSVCWTSKIGTSCSVQVSSLLQDLFSSGLDAASRSVQFGSRRCFKICSIQVSRLLQDLFSSGLEAPSKIIHSREKSCTGDCSTRLHEESFKACIQPVACVLELT